jgi:hypothetical protein
MEDQDAMSRELHADEVERRYQDMQDRLALMGQLLTCAVAKLGGEMAVTKTEIERAVQGQQISLTSLPHDRGFYVALTTYNPGGNDVTSLDAAAAHVRRDAHPGS